MFLSDHQQTIFMSILLTHSIIFIKNSFSTAPKNQTHSTLENWKSYLENCSDANNVDIIRGLEIMSVEDELVLILENEKCFIKCMGESMSFLKSDGSINQTSLRPVPWFLNDNKIGSVVRKCSRIVGTSSCDKAYEQSVCFFGIASIDAESEEY